MAVWVEFASLKRAMPLATVLEQYRVSGLRRSGRDRYRGRCPIHRGDGEDAFHVNLAKQVFHCFSCGAGGTVLDFVAAMERCGLREAALKLTNWSATPAWDAASARCAERRQLVTEKGGEAEPAPLGFALRGVDPRHPYLTARGIEERTAAAFGMGFYRGPGLFQGRLVIPIHNPEGRLVGYCGRSLDGSEPRYKFPPGFAKAALLFNLHRAAAHREPAVIVVEGFFDCLKVHQAGFGSVVALMGAALSRAQQELLTSRFRRVILMLDGDATGRRASLDIANRLRVACTVRVVALAAEAQPDQLPAAALRAVLAQKRGIAETA